MNIEKEANYVRVESELAIAAEELWRITGNLAAVNKELYPLSMKSQKEFEAIHLRNAPVQQELFSSLITLFGIFPLDLHNFYLESVGPDCEFMERSSSYWNRYWRHHRKIIPIEKEKCLLIDELAFQNRFEFLSKFFKPIYRFVFLRRHRFLKKALMSRELSL